MAIAAEYIAPANLDGIAEDGPKLDDLDRLDRLSLGMAAMRLRLARQRGNVPKAILDERHALEEDHIQWLRAMFPKHTKSPFAQHHLDFWEWLWQLEPGMRPPPYIMVLARGGAKSTTVELAVAALAARKKRRYALYCCGTQAQADDHVGNVAAMLESPEFDRLYPDTARPFKTRYGKVRGWRRDRVRTSSGFTLDAIGLDTAMRGIKLDDARPDLIVLDDIDSELDTPVNIEKKLLSLTRKLLPAGSSDTAIIAIQNLVHSNSIFSRLADSDKDRADFLIDRHVVGPIPAIANLHYAKQQGRYVITGGEATWAGQTLETCQGQINDWGLTAFLHEAQHEVYEQDGGMFSHLDWLRIDWANLPSLTRIVVWVDPAVTDRDDSDACGIQCDALGVNGVIYRLWSWEERTSPEDVMRRAIAKAMELHAECVGVETDQGGDTWKSSYARAWVTYCNQNGLDPEKSAALAPKFRAAKAGAGHGPKVHRASQMLADYERGTIVHVQGTHTTLERALRRFPKIKPFDLTDAAYWAWADLRERLVRPKVAPQGSVGKSKWRFA